MVCDIVILPDNQFARTCNITSRSRSGIGVNRLLPFTTQIESYRTARERSTPNWPWRKPQAALHGVYTRSDLSAPKGRLSWRP